MNFKNKYIQITKKFFYVILIFFIPFTNSGNNPKNQDLSTNIPDTKIEEESELDWKDYEIPDIFPEIKILDQLDPKKSEKYLKSAKENYELAQSIIKNAKKEVESVPDKYKHLPENQHWQIQEKQEKIQKKQNEILTNAYQKAKIHIIKGLEDLEKIKAKKILESEYYINLKSNLLRNFVLVQLSLKETSGIIPTIEEYFSLKPEHKEEPQPYKILAYCYQYMEKISIKSNAKEEVVLQFRKSKYKNLLKYTEIKYGKDSYEYNIIKKQLEREWIPDTL